MKLIAKIKKIILVFVLAGVIAFSSPLAVFAQEATGAPEAGGAPEAATAPEAAPAPEAEASPTPSPSPTVETSTDDTFNQESGPAYSYGDWDHDYDEEDEDDRDWRDDNYSGNVGDTSITSGDATANGQATTTANSTTLSPAPSCSVCVDDVTVKNSGNGTNSNNDSSVNFNSDSTVSIDNDANVNNNLNLDADSGDNKASYNVGNSEITTGDANVSGVVITSANETGLGVVEYNILGDHNGDIILVVPDGLFGCPLCGLAGDVSVENTGNGTDSTNSGAVTIDNSSDTTINNTGNVVNNMNLDADSGDNKASYNTGGDSSITTGDANVAANLINFVNSTIGGGVAFVVNIFGDLVGDIIFPDSLPGIGGTALSATNSGNGSDSTNNVDINSNNQNDTTINNLATIDNVILIDANTGKNETKYNTGGDNLIDTGDVFVNAEVLNVVNTNLLGSSDEPLWLILVNNMGTWTGNIIGALTGINYSGGGGLVFTVDENGEVVASNMGNGAGSTNDITIDQNNTNNLTINNTANITNNINIDANTGKNEANYNTGGDSTIKTGDVNVAASIFNFVNTNIIGRTLMLGIINVFGSWTGDAVPPGQDPNPESASASSGGSSGGGSSSNSSSGGSGSAGIASAILGGYPYPHMLKPTGLGFFGGLGGGDQSSVITGGDAPTVLGDSVESDGLFSITLNWKILLFSLIPLILYGFLRTRNLSSMKKQEAAIAHEIKIKKKK